jgi:hypothetical protein
LIFPAKGSPLELTFYEEEQKFKHVMLVRRQQQNKQQLNLFGLIPADTADSTLDMSHKYILFILKNVIDMQCITQKTELSI